MRKHGEDGLISEDGPDGPSRTNSRAGLTPCRTTPARGPSRRCRWRSTDRMSAAPLRSSTTPAHPYVLHGELAVLRVALLGEGLAEVGVEVFHHRPRRVQVLEEQEDHRQLVQQVDAQHDAPEGCYGGALWALSSTGRTQAETHLGGAERTGRLGTGSWRTRGTTRRRRRHRYAAVNERGPRRAWRRDVHAFLLLALLEHVLRHGDVREDGHSHSKRGQGDRLVEEPGTAWASVALRACRRCTTHSTLVSFCS